MSGTGTSGRAECSNVYALDCTSGDFPNCHGDLTAALADGRLSGAALDVFATEPLPPDSPLWAMPNVLLSPHTAALSVLENARIVELFCENLRRYLASADLINCIDPALLY